ncbi:MAG: hypothetical protein K8S56_01330, partial [Candidatus Cloacimonetes bacterium]|nr:hypothetical protein [Candidatus Cloacimonadota bacterium]
MEIHKNDSFEQKIKNIKSKRGRKRLFYALLIIIGLSIFGLITFYYGMLTYKTGGNWLIRMFAHRLNQRDFSFIKNEVSSYSSEIDHFDLEISHINMQKLRYNREMALRSGYLTKDLEIEVPAIIRYKNKKYRIRISLTGTTIEHIMKLNKWSFAVKVKGGKSINGMKKFAFLVPRSRGYLTDWIAQQLLMSRGAIGIRCNFADV